MLSMAGMAAAQNADDYRGGWRTDSGEPHTYGFSIRGDQVRGIYCTRSSDATTLAFIDGKFGADGITFVVHTCEGRRQHGVSGSWFRQVRQRQSDHNWDERRSQ